jgi:tripartite-type tricarboxylate transporter receptor subunit TctC
MRKAVLSSIALAFAAAILLSVGPTKAQSPAEFYRGKTLRMLIGYGPGGGYDLYGRLVAEFLPRHIPGNPTMVPQNMPGAGSFVAAKYMAEVAPKDGTVFGSLSQTLALDSMIGNTAKIDVSTFAYVGRAVTNVDAGVALPKSGIKSFDDVRKKEYTVGASGGGSTTVMYPTALNQFADSKFKIVKGYSGTTDIQLAMERGEVDILPAYGLPGILVSKPDWINKGEAVFLYQAALKRHRLLPNAPTLPELALDDEGRAVLHAIASTAEIGRSINTTPGVPAERLAVLRAAFAAMLKDPEFIAASDKRNLMIDGATGEEMDAIVRDTLKIPSSVLAKVGQVSN